MGEYEELVERLRAEGIEELAEEFAKFSNQEMRKRVGRTVELERENETLKAELTQVKSAPKRAAALKAAGVDVDKLSPAEVEVIASQKPGDGKDYDEEWAKGLVERYKLPVEEGEGDEGERIPAKDFERPGGPVGGGQNPGKAALKPEVVNAWPVDKRMRLMEVLDKNGKMEVWDRLLQGESVVLDFPFS